MHTKKQHEAIVRQAKLKDAGRAVVVQQAQVFMELYRKQTKGKGK